MPIKRTQPPSFGRGRTYFAPHVPLSENDQRVVAAWYVEVFGKTAPLAEMVGAFAWDAVSSKLMAESENREI
jgi:hypothetical protein